jgi:hypothetical protein
MAHMVYKVDKKLIKLLISSIPTLSETLKMSLITLATQLDIHTNSELRGSHDVNESQWNLWLKSRDTVFELLVQTIYEFVHIFIATFLSNTVANIPSVIDIPSLNAVFRVVSVVVYVVYILEHKMYSEMIRYTMFMVINHVINPLYKKLTNNTQEVNGMYVYFTFTLLKIFYTTVINRSIDLDKLIQSIFNIPNDFTKKNILEQIHKATSTSHVLHLTSGGVNLLLGVVNKIFSNITIERNFAKKIVHSRSD